MGVVPNDKAVLPMVSPDELCCIAIVKEWVKNRPDFVLLEALLEEENIMAYLHPP